MRDKIKNLSEPIVGATEGAYLSRLFRSMLKDLNLMNKTKWLIDRYVSDNKKSNVKVKKLKSRSSITSNVVSEEMTWKTFLDLTFNLLKVKDCKIYVELTHRDNSSSVHEVLIPNNKDMEKLKEDKNDGK